MSIYFTRRCPNCDFILKYFRGSHIVVGNPHFTCPKCGVKIKIDNVREWDDFNSFGKVWRIFAHIVMSFFYGLIIALAVFGTATHLLKLDLDSSKTESVNLVCVLIATIVGVGILFTFRAIHFFKKIKESIERTRKQQSNQDLSISTTIIKMGG